jgi:hypothetical protein
MMRMVIGAPVGMTSLRVRGCWCAAVACSYLRGLWAGVQLRNDGATSVGTSFRPLKVSVRDTAESLIALCGIRPRLRTANL